MSTLPLRIAVIVVTCTAVGACIRGMKVEISGDITAPIFRLAPAYFLERGPVCLTDVEVWRTGAEDRSELIWRLHAVGTTCPKVSRLKYSDRPEGFQTLVAAKPLELGKEYVIQASGWGWIGACAFTYREPTQATSSSDFCRVRK